jgi:hypothetical protein
VRPSRFSRCVFFVWSFHAILARIISSGGFEWQYSWQGYKSTRHERAVIIL